MERLDKFVSNHTVYSRKDVKILCLRGLVTVDGNVVKRSDSKIDETLEIIVDGEVVNKKDNIYLVLNKPEGYISATEDKVHKTVLDLVPERFKMHELFPAGRLDKDTTGLMIITDDGKFVHDILAPRKHVKKVYEVRLDVPVTEEMASGFREGVVLSDGECKEAELEKVSEFECVVTIREGRYHQIKRMFGCFGAKVVSLNRVQIGDFRLPGDLELGEVREISDDDVRKLKEK